MSVGLVVKPLIAGFAAISFMPARSAPSANNFTFKLDTALIALLPVSLGEFGEDPAAGLGERFYRDIRWFGALFAVTVVDEETRASRSLTRGHVSPAVADHEASLEVNAEFAGGLHEHSRFWFTAVAAVGVAVVADFDVVERQVFFQAPVHGLDGFELDPSGRDVRLIRDDDVQAPRATQRRKRLANSLEDFLLFDGLRRVRSSAPNNRLVDDAIAV